MAAEFSSGVSGKRRHSAGDLLAVDWSTVCDTMSGRETRCHSVQCPPQKCPPGHYSLVNNVPPDIIH